MTNFADLEQWLPEIAELADETFALQHSFKNYDQWIQEFAKEINLLIDKDFNKLVNILYRLDINETKLKQSLLENSGQDAGKIIAELIVERQIQKLKSRAQFKSNVEIPEDEKW